MDTAPAGRVADAPTSTSLLDTLRRSTHEDHEGLDAVFARLDLTREADYARFLATHFVALAPLQTAYHEFCRETLDIEPVDLLALLRRDLLDMGQEPARLEPLPAPETVFDAPAGLAYVLAGSRLGLTVIGKQPHHGTAAEAPSRFMDDTAGLAVWRTLSAWLKRQDGEGEPARLAAQAARAVFAPYHRALHACQSRSA